MSLGAHQIIVAPILTEESQIQIRKANQFTFRVHKDANKKQIREALEAIYPDIKITGVNTINYQGKRSAMTGRRRPGHKPNWKKAIVTLREGDTINLI
ncbi:MAG: ribosomal subunit protein [Candidatus Hydrogenedentota bacterium]